MGYASFENDPLLKLLKVGNMAPAYSKLLKTNLGLERGCDWKTAQ